MKHEYAADELRELKSIYDESGEAGLSRDEMRALRKAGLVTQDLPPKPEKPHEDTLADYQALSAPEPEKPKLQATSTNRHTEMREAATTPSPTSARMATCRPSRKSPTRSTRAKAQ